MESVPGERQVEQRRHINTLRPLTCMIGAIKGKTRF
jgi:hypothetical protein